MTATASWSTTRDESTCAECGQHYAPGARTLTTRTGATEVTRTGACAHRAAKALGIGDEGSWEEVPGVGRMWRRLP